MSVGVQFPPGLGDEPVPVLTEPQSVAPDPFTLPQSVMPPEDLAPPEVDPSQICRPPDDGAPDPELPPYHPGVLIGDLSKADEAPVPTIAPRPPVNPFDFWGD